MWVQLTVCKQVEVNGKPKNYYPGDWVDVGKMDARVWLVAGEAVIPAQRIAELLPGDAGVVLTTNAPQAAQVMGQFDDVLNVKVTECSIPWSRTLIWDGIVPLRLELVPDGFNLLETWEIVCPLMDSGTMAMHLGAEEDRVATKDLVHDLRVPVYRSGAMWVRDCKTTRKLLKVWEKEEGDRDLAFLRAVYRVRPLILAVPHHWASTKPY